jgi:hypothetical protein
VAAVAGAVVAGAVAAGAAAAGEGEEAMKSTFLVVVVVASSLAFACATPPKTPASSQPVAQKVFTTPEEAADALIQAAASFDVPALLDVLGPDGKDLVASKDSVGDRNRAVSFASKAKEKRAVTRDPDDPGRATLLVGNDDWPFAIPILEDKGKWYFESKAGRDEILRRRIGANELDALAVCRGYAEAQQQYASETHDGSGVNQYAQRLVSTPGRHDGLAWQNADGTWGGPVGETVAKSIEQGYTKRGEPFHGYYFRVLKGQGPAARLGQLDYVIGGAMIGGFALIAWPAEYGVTGVQTLMVSYDDVVYQKDLGPETASIAPAIDRYDPDATWTRTDDDW